MEEPKVLLFVGPEANVYQTTGYENIKTSVELTDGHETFLEILKMWYEELAFTYRFDSSMQDLINMGVIKKEPKENDYELSDIHNSLLFIRSKIIHEMGNSMISHLNMRIDRKWNNIKNELEKLEKESQSKEE